jgi:thiol-disulfide isomerase/thioredoxin
MMNMHFKNILCFLVCLLAIAGSAQYAKTPLKTPAARPNLYPVDANAQREIKEALLAAAPGNKRVILVFGANWCGDCYALNYAFHQPRIAPLLNANFKVVHINVGGSDGTGFDKNLDLAEKYHLPIKKGIPSVAVIDSHDRLLYSTPEFEKARMMTEEDVIQFLNAWKPPASKASK